MTVLDTERAETALERRLAERRVGARGERARGLCRGRLEPRWCLVCCPRSSHRDGIPAQRACLWRTCAAMYEKGTGTRREILSGSE